MSGKGVVVTENVNVTADDWAAIDAARAEAEAGAAPAAGPGEASPAAQTVVVEGFTLQIDPELLDDYEMLDQASQGAPFRMFDALVGDQKQAILAHLKGPAKRISLGRVAEFIEQVFKAVGRGN